MRSALLLIVLAACSRPDASPPGPAAGSGTAPSLSKAPPAKRVGRRNVIARAKLKGAPTAQQPRLPLRGLAWSMAGPDGHEQLVVLDVETGAATVTSPLPSGLPSTTSLIVPLGDAERLWAQAEDVWREPRPAYEHAANTGEDLVIVDHDDAYELWADGPIEGSPATSLVEQLRKLAQR